MNVYTRQNILTLDLALIDICKTRRQAAMEVGIMSINKKIQIMKVYKGELNKHPFPRSEKSIKALGTFRGSTSGCKFAESFVLLKEVF